jgi:hypothetical protein
MRRRRIFKIRHPGRAQWLNDDPAVPARAGTNPPDPAVEPARYDEADDDEAGYRFASIEQRLLERDT